AGAGAAADRWLHTMSGRLPIVQECEGGAYAAMAEVIRTAVADPFATATVPMDSRHAGFRALAGSQAGCGGMQPPLSVTSMQYYTFSFCAGLGNCDRARTYATDGRTTFARLRVSCSRSAALRRACDRAAAQAASSLRGVRRAPSRARRRSSMRLSLMPKGVLKRRRVPPSNI